MSTSSIFSKLSSGLYKLRTIKKTISTPTYIFQMGKVGSMSLRTTLPKYLKGEIVHAHLYSKMSIKHQRLLELRKSLYLPINIICPIRDPISRNISAFFQNFKRDTGLEIYEREWEVNELLNLFLNNFPHNVCLEWFDRYFRPIFNIDVFAEPFPIEKKWNVYKKKSIRVLIYRCDLDKQDQLDIISQFLRIKISDWNYSNISENKQYNKIYRKFCSSVKLPDIYINIMNNSSFYQHFWNEEERIQNFKKWSDN
ncbi:MAG: putative capsular polysaccharide synthesis family protein [Xenococcaceae cyanobacterium MO_188.B32]|nr:putative capsular polysaccharide synthesis family protein [Xenococcaceae cyanobacterium MO_188.B32]